MVVCIIWYPGGPYYLPFNVGLWILFGMQVYWFKFILRLLFKLLILHQEIEDARELDEDEDVGNTGSGEALSNIDNLGNPIKPRHRRPKE